MICLFQGRIDLLKSSTGKLIYKLKDPGAAEALKGGDQQEKVVYQIIKDAGNKGILILAVFHYLIYSLR